MAKLWRHCKDQRQRERWLGGTQGFWEQSDNSAWYSNGGHMSWHVCQDPKMCNTKSEPQYKMTPKLKVYQNNKEFSTLHTSESQFSK